MRIAVITDAHANLLALEAALRAIHREGVDLIVHTGDAIAIGPHPAECLELLVGMPHVQCLMGNHESYFVDGLPRPLPDGMTDGELQNQRWTHAQLNPQLRPVLAQWPYVLECKFEGVRTVFLHYGLGPSGGDFVPTIKRATASDLDRAFLSHDAALIFYGHDHAASDLEGRARYVNPGSLGCCDRAVARYCIAEFHRGRCAVAHRSVPYDDADVFTTFERRCVPERHFIYRAFFGGRFSG